MIHLKDKIGELYNVNQITKNGWKLISIIPFSIKKNNKEIQIHRLYFQRVGRKLLLKKIVKNSLLFRDRK